MHQISLQTQPAPPHHTQVILGTEFELNLAMYLFVFVQGAVWTIKFTLCGRLMVGVLLVLFVFGSCLVSFFATWSKFFFLFLTGYSWPRSHGGR